jgi:S-layer protein (TIGR01564 family)
VPSGQAVAGAAVTGPQGSLDTGGGSGSVESQTPTGFPEGALLDSEVTSSQRQNTNHILVGGPAVNDLVSTLVDQGEADVPRAGASPPGVTPADGNATGGNATDGNATDGGATEGTTETYGEGDAAIQLVEDSFADGANSLIVAGFTGEDTRQAANRLANADENPLPGQDRFTVETGQ